VGVLQLVEMGRGAWSERVRTDTAAAISEQLLLSYNRSYVGYEYLQTYTFTVERRFTLTLPSLSAIIPLSFAHSLPYLGVSFPLPHCFLAPCHYPIPFSSRFFCLQLYFDTRQALDLILRHIWEVRISKNSLQLSLYLWI
jgi:hypothetical protein